MPPRQHDHESEHCWCGPDLRQICPECDGEDPERFSCWRCKADTLGPGWVEPYDDQVPLVVQHKDAGAQHDELTLVVERDASQR